MKRFLTVLLTLALLMTLTVPALAFGKAGLSTQNLMVNGKPVACEKYNIDGSNYFKLRDLAMALNGTESQFDVGWDGAKKLVTLTTRHPYTTARGDELTEGTDQSATTAESRDALVIDGVERSDIAAYKIGGSNFFKLRDLGVALGFDVDYIDATRTATVASRTALQVTDLCFLAGQYTEQSGYVNDYSYALPKLSGLDTPYVRAINADMQALYNAEVASALGCMRDEVSLNHWCIAYYYAVRCGVHSILVTVDSDWGMTDYRCYIFDAMGNELDNAAVLAAAGLTEDGFLKLARGFLKERTDLSAYFHDDSWKPYQDQTLDPANFNAAVPMALLPSGELCFICTVYGPAGAGAYDTAYAISGGKTVGEAGVGTILSDRLKGCWLAESGQEATLCEILTVGDTLMMELTDLGREDSGYYVMSYSAVELFPEDPAQLYRADVDSLTVRAVDYYPDVFAGTYGGEEKTCMLSLTADGLTLSGPSGVMFSGKHCYKGDLGYDEALPEKDYARFRYDDVEALGVAGVWTGTYRDDAWKIHSLTLELTSWGELRLRDCVQGEIPRVMEGWYYVAGLNDPVAPAAGVVFQLTRRGGYKMPSVGWCTLVADKHGTLRVIEEADSDTHLTMLGEYEDAAVLQRVPAQRSVVKPSVRQIAEDARYFVDIDADGVQEQIVCALHRPAEYGGDINGITVTVDGEPFAFDDLMAYNADIWLIRTAMSGTVWLYVDALSDNDYHCTTVYGVRPGQVWSVGEFYGGFVAAPTDPEAMQLWSRFSLMSTLDAARTYRVGLSGFPEPVSSFYRIDSASVLTSKRAVEGWTVNAAGELGGEPMTIPAGTKATFVRTDGAYATDLQLPDGRACRVFVSDWPREINGVPVEDCFDGIGFAG